jgi:hypothetical protein
VSSKKKKEGAWTTWEEMPLEVFQVRAAEVEAAADAFVSKVDECLPGLVTMTKDQRRRAPRLRDGEHDMMLKVLQVVDLKPALFESLADQDEGMDPRAFESMLLRDRIEKHRLFSRIAEKLSPLGGKLSDSTLYTATKFRDALYAAYRIAKTHAETDRRINDVLAPVIDFMRRNAVAAAKKRVDKPSDEA